MIIVTGTKRSGTSLWMQVLIAAGFPYFGSAFLDDWRDSIADANPRGFYESRLRHGIYFRSNPDPKTGEFLFPSETKDLAVKVFIPGLIRTDYSFIDKVVATVRPWREYCVSLERLHQLEDSYYLGQGSSEALAELERVKKTRSPLPPEVEWWVENYDLIRDIATRRYSYLLVAYGRLLADPTGTIKSCFELLGSGSLAKAAAVVEPQLHREKNPRYFSKHITLDEQRIFDELYELVYQQKPLTSAFLDRMNSVNRGIRERFPGIKLEG